MADATPPHASVIEARYPRVRTDHPRVKIRILKEYFEILDNPNPRPYRVNFVGADDVISKDERLLGSWQVKCAPHTRARALTHPHTRKHALHTNALIRSS